jgi:hypothetical protein
MLVDRQRPWDYHSPMPKMHSHPPEPTPQELARHRRELDHQALGYSSAIRGAPMPPKASPAWRRGWQEGKQELAWKSRNSCTCARGF